MRRELRAKLELGLLVNFGGDSLEWKRVVLSRKPPRQIDLQAAPKNSR